MARMLPGEAELVQNEQVCQGAKSVKRFERANGRDTALYKNILYLFYINSIWSSGIVIWQSVFDLIPYFLSVLLQFT